MTLPRLYNIYKKACTGNTSTLCNYEDITWNAPPGPEGGYADSIVDAAWTLTMQGDLTQLQYERFIEAGSVHGIAH
jgi:hypothetical protein